MKKKITIMLFMIMLFAMTLNVYAYEPVEWFTDESEDYDVNWGPSLDAFVFYRLCIQACKNSISGIENMRCLTCTSEGFGNAYFFEDDTVSVLYDGTVYSIDGKEYRSYKMKTYYLNSDGELQLCENQLMEVMYYYGSSHYLRKFKAYSNKFPQYLPDDLLATTQGREQYCNQPFTNNEADALMYLKTGDAGYLVNSEEFIEISEPKNVSIYQASSENNCYVYYENDYVIGANIEKMQTRYAYMISYNDANGERVDIFESEELAIDYIGRNQIPISYTPLLNYDNGFVQVMIWNEFTYSNGNVLRSNAVYLEYYPYEKYCKKTVYDKDTNEAGDVFEIVVNDYDNKNDSYTGGNTIIDTDIKNADDGNYGIIGNIFKGFGLLGDNGALAIIIDSVGVIPDEIILCISTFVGLVCIVGLFKMAFS